MIRKSDKISIQQFKKNGILFFVIFIIGVITVISIEIQQPFSNLSILLSNSPEVMIQPAFSGKITCPVSFYQTRAVYAEGRTQKEATKKCEEGRSQYNEQFIAQCHLWCSYLPPMPGATPGLVCSGIPSPKEITCTSRGSVTSTNVETGHSWSTYSAAGTAFVECKCVLRPSMPVEVLSAQWREGGVLV